MNPGAPVPLPLKNFPLFLPPPPSPSPSLSRAGGRFCPPPPPISCPRPPIPLSPPFLPPPLLPSPGPPRGAALQRAAPDRVPAARTGSWRRRLKRLVMRSPFDVRLEKPKREGEATLLYPFDACVAWVAACHHRTSSRISWDLCSSPAVRLEPLFDDLLPALSSDDRLPAAQHLRFSVEVGPSFDFERRRSSSAASSRTRSSRPWRHEASRPTSTPTRLTSCSSCAAQERLDARRTVVGIDIGGGARHRRGARVAAGPAPLRETMAAQLIMLSRWDARTEPLVDPMAGGATIPIEAAGLAVGAAIRRPVGSPAAPSRRVQGSAARSARPVPRDRAADRRARRRRRRAFPRWWATCAPPG